MNKFFRLNSPGRTAFPVAQAGYPFILASAFITVVLAFFGITWLALTGLAATSFICYFFRDPDRVAPDMERAVVSPADGKIITAGPVEKNRFMDGRCLRISIFMSVFNVHVNRIPCEGEITRISYYPGKFFSANLDKASKYNEHNALYIQADNGQKLCLVQIAGLIARRIICYVKQGARMKTGQRFGIICFGSRVEVYLPENSKISVAVGDKVKAGTTIIGYLHEKKKQQ